MKRYLLFFCLVITALSSCKKSSNDDYDAVAQLATDEKLIQAYLATNNITAVRDPSGVYYQIITPGGAEKPTTSNGVGVIYTGTLLSSGTVFETHDTVIYFASLGSLIEGWKIGIPKIGKDGHIKLFIPSTLAYKNQASSDGTIPANSVLIFDIKLVGFN